MADLIIKGGTVLTMSDKTPEKCDVVVENGLITFIKKDPHEEADKIIDAKGCFVMPGLVNAHTHLAMTLFRGFADDLPYREWIQKIQAAEMKLTPADVRKGAYLGALEMIKSGTTSCADMYIHMDEVASVVEKTGIRAALGYGMIEGLNEDPTTKLRIREKFNRFWSGTANGRITTMYAPHSASTCSKGFLERVRDLARKEGARIHIHMLETEEELDLMKSNYNMCSVNLLDTINMLGPETLAAHCIWLSDHDLEVLKNKNVNVVHCPTSNIALGAGVARIPEMLEKGINVALGTDSAASGGSLDMWKEMRTAQMLHKIKNPRAMHAPDVLGMATINGAKALGINAGILKAGCFADIIIVDLKKPQFVSADPVTALVNGASGCDVRTTIVNGKVLMEDHVLMELDEEKIIEDARKIIRKIWSGKPILQKMSQ
ncbi:MAG: amidohydrolase family protein [Candidatus Methanoperedens sp.]|nr:amidohydrolase family protein [Candidatus Methanoperedens sp.]